MEDTTEKPLIFDFAKYTEVTDLALKVNPEYEKAGYIRVFICQDVNDYWLVRILKGYDEDYKEDEDSYLMERDKIAKDHKSDKLTLSKVKAILKKDEFENWDIKARKNIKDLIEIIDGGFGINNLKE